MNEIMYLKQVGDEVICTNYFGINLEKKRKYPIQGRFQVDNNIKSVYLSGKKIYVMLSSELVLVFKNMSVLKNEAFKELAEDLKIHFVKYFLKQTGSNAKFYVRKALDTRPKLSAIMAVIVAGAISFSNITNYNSHVLRSSVLTNDSKASYLSIDDELPDTLSITESSNETSSVVESTISGINISNETSDLIEENNSIDEIEAMRQETSYNEEDLIVSKDSKTNDYVVVGNKDFYSGELYNNLVTVMNSANKTAQMNQVINDYISNNLAGEMWANAEYLNYNEYTIPEKYKNGQFTLDELFTDAANTFNIPKDILVAVSQHECAQAYYPMNSYTLEYEKNCGGMMGFLDILDLNKSHLPEGGYDGCDIYTNPAIPVYVYASTVRFFYDNFKNINVGNGFDAWDIALAMIAIGPGDVSDINVGFKYRQDYEDRGWSQLNICAPQFKVLREAYKNNMLGVNDLVFTAENGVITHWTDSELFTYENGIKGLRRQTEQSMKLTK